MRPIQLYFRGAIRSIAPASIQRTLLQWLREDEHACGTKEGCNEGDCGACTVVVGELDAAGELQLSAINACLQLLPALDRKAVLTVEDLRGTEDGAALHPVQQAMVEGHASQCGFCTPGFVMSLYALYEQHSTAPARAVVEDALSGNLCRCTGYRPIVDAAGAAYQHPRRALSRAPIVAALRDLQALPALDVSDGKARWQAPTSLDALSSLRLAQPDARLVAGTTDVGLWVTKQLRDLGDVISLLAVPELQRVEQRDGWLHLGAGARLQTCFEQLTQLYPEWSELWRRFASLPIRNAGTLGGNVANGSPIGDSMPGLIALGAEVVLRRGGQQRRMPLEHFYLGYQQTALQAGEWLEAVEVPARQPGQIVRFHKVSKRFDQDISAVCLGFSAVVREGTLREVRVAYGGMAAICKRAPAAEAVLEGATFSHASFAAAAAAVQQDFQPLSDARASADYRRTIAGNLLRRCALELLSTDIPVRLLDVAALSAD